MDTELKHKLQRLKVEHFEKEIENLYREYVWAKEQYIATRSNLNRAQTKLRVLKHRMKKGEA